MSDPIPQELLDVLCCPEDKAGLKHSKKKGTLNCAKCGREYAIKNGIPVLLPEQVAQENPEEIKK
jgi:uncharacterized protein YbaR (Trm112 family)